MTLGKTKNTCVSTNPTDPNFFVPTDPTLKFFFPFLNKHYKSQNVSPIETS